MSAPNKRISPLGDSSQLHSDDYTPYNRMGDTQMRGFMWLGLAFLLFVAWVGSYVVYHVAGFLIHLLLVFALISVLIHIYSEIREPGPRD